MTLTLPDLLAGIAEHATPGPGASGRWLAGAPDAHLLAVYYAHKQAGAQPACLDTIIKVTLELLTVEGLTPVRAGDLHRYVGWVGTAAGLEWQRREGLVTVDPPLVSIFAAESHDSVIRPGPKSGGPATTT